MNKWFLTNNIIITVIQDFLPFFLGLFQIYGLDLEPFCFVWIVCVRNMGPFGHSITRLLILIDTQNYSSPKGPHMAHAAHAKVLGTVKLAGPQNSIQLTCYC